MSSRLPPLSSLIRAALREDAARRDCTSRAVIPASRRIRARVIAKMPGIVAGAEVARRVFQTVDPRLRCRVLRRDGQPLQSGQAILAVSGRARSIFAAERVALNFLGHLCGVATLTAHFVKAVRPYHAHILDTRKTLPGLRALEKHAVRVGGGRSHRASLSDAVLIKTNHLRINCGLRNADCGMVIQDAIVKAKRLRPRKFVEIEVTNLAELKAALAARPDALLLDNWTVSAIRKAVRLRNRTPYTVHRTPFLEVSGGVTLANVRAIARTGVDRISIGRLTHSAPWLDVSLRVV